MSKNYKISYFKKPIFSLVCLATLFYPSLSKAGFEWTPPAPIALPAPIAPVAPPPATDTVIPSQQPAGPLTPELSQESDSNSNLPVPVGHVEQAPVTSTAPEQKTVPAPEVKKTMDFPIVEGFGKDIPLAIALRDIVPTHFAYAFNPREIAGTKISWRGGKTWPEVLQNALLPHHLDGVVDGNTITIYAKQIETPPVVSESQSIPKTKPEAEPEAKLEPISGSTDPTDPIPLASPMPLVSEAPVAAPSQHNMIPVVDLKHHQKWVARPGATLRETLESWSKSAGTEISWSTPYDYPINNAFYFEGSFSNAVDSLLSSYGGESPSPKGRLYPNLPDGPSVLMIN